MSADYKDWGGSTNLRKVFDLILADAIISELKPDQMISTLIIFTDMQFDSVCHDSESTFDYAHNIYEAHGYPLPKIVCWNLRTSVTKSLPITADSTNYVMLSGFSAELLKHILNGDTLTPFSMMLHVLEPYDISIGSDSIFILDRPFDLDQLQKAIELSTIKKAYIKSPTIK